MQEVMLPIVEGLAAEGRPYRGVLYAGLMITAVRPRCSSSTAASATPRPSPC